MHARGKTLSLPIAGMDAVNKRNSLSLVNRSPFVIQFVGTRMRAELSHKVV